MGNKVYANGREVSCKAADGKSICAFPDVCMTPPENPATPPGVPVPYPNTGMASDMTEGSKNVKVSGKEVMLKNKSYFKKSTGDEAGAAAKKGVVTSTNTGKVYFTSWSMDVKFEGENVVRHLDMTTHNHMCSATPPNTPTWPYLDAMAFGSDSHPCSEVAKEVKNNCEQHIEKTKSKTDPQVKRKPSIDAMCADDKCRESLKCVLSPYDPSNCCEQDGTKKTPHHVVPKHCIQKPGQGNSSNPDVYDGCDGYNSNKAPCICVTGKDKSTGDHKKVHDIFDPLEDSNMVGGKASTWTYDDAAYTGSAAVADVTGCNEDCIRSQVDSYHKKPPPDKPNIKNETNLRADSTGQHTPDNFTTVTSGVAPD